MHKKGFTLVELLIYMALVVIFLGILTNLFISVIDVKNESISVGSIEQDVDLFYQDYYMMQIKMEHNILVITIL